MEALTPHLTVDVVRDGRASGGAYALLEVRAPAGFTVPHNVNRRCAGALRVLDGSVELVLDARSQRIEPGGHAEVPRGVPWRAVVETDAHLLWFGAPAGIESLAALLGSEALEDDDAAALLAAAGVSRVRASW